MPGPTTKLGTCTPLHVEKFRQPNYVLPEILV
jgi:hypothetical protein